MIRHTISNLRSVDWAPPVSWRQLKMLIEYDRRNNSDKWKFTPWQRSGGANPHRSYLVTSEGGGIYAIFFRKL